MRLYQSFVSSVFSVINNVHGQIQPQARQLVLSKDKLEGHASEFDLVYATVARGWTLH